MLNLLEYESADREMAGRRPHPITGVAIAGQVSMRGIGCVGLFSMLCIGCVVPISTAEGPGDGAPDVTGRPDSQADGGQTNTMEGSAGESDAAVPPGSWTNVTANLANMASTCGNMSAVSAKPDEDLLIAGVAVDGLWASTDGAKSWHPLTTSTITLTAADAGAITNRPSGLVFDPANPMRYWESGTYGSGAYETSDDGKTFVQLGSVNHCDSISVDFSDPSRLTLLAGGHEMSQTLYRSLDKGMTWNNVGTGLPSNTNCTIPFVVDSQTYLVGCGGFGGGPTGIYRTTDGGATWTKVSASGGAAAPLKASDGSIYWADPLDRGMTRSTDNGQKWVDVVGKGVVNSVHPIELPDGRLAALGPQYVVVSSDQGATWKPATASLPYGDAAGVVYSSFQKAFYVWHWTCSGNGSVPADAIMRFSFDYKKG